MATLFISDLHLPTVPSPLREGFTRFLRGPARGAEAVYILGDLFEYWIGDDAGVVDYAAEIAELKQLTASGVPVYFMHGNRDFLVGRRFTAASGVGLLPDPVKLDLAGVATLLSHGDRWCTDDRNYQYWRRFSRNPLARAALLALPVAARHSIAQSLRVRSSEQKQYKPQEIMDVNEGAVCAAFGQHRVTRIIHGHTHRPAEHSYPFDGGRGERIVLADWHPERMEALAVSADGILRVTSG